MKAVILAGRLEPYGMDDVIKRAKSKKKLVTGFITKNGFTDIGNKESYKQATQTYIVKFGKKA